MSVVIGNAQDVGSRDRQEDYFSSKEISGMNVAVLADGMGGYEGGDQASSTVTQGFIRFIEQQARKYPAIPDLLVDAAYSANAELARVKQNTNSNMGSTLVAVLVRGNHAWWVSIGDSLLYLWRDDRLQKLNADHSHYQDLRQKVFLGQMSTAQAANDPERDGLTSALMGREMKHVDVSRFGIELKGGDIFLLASDGLETLSPEQIASILPRVSDPQKVANTLVQQVMRAKVEHQDNVSILVVGTDQQNGTGASTKMVNPPSNSWLKTSYLMLLAGLILGGSVSFLLIQTVFKSATTPVQEPLPSQSAPTTPTNEDASTFTCEDERKRAKEVCELVFSGYPKSLEFCPKIEATTKAHCDTAFNEVKSTGKAITNGMSATSPVVLTTTPHTDSTTPIVQQQNTLPEAPSQLENKEEGFWAWVKRLLWLN